MLPNRVLTLFDCAAIEARRLLFRLVSDETALQLSTKQTLLDYYDANKNRKDKNDLFLLSQLS